MRKTANRSKSDTPAVTSIIACPPYSPSVSSKGAAVYPQKGGPVRTVAAGAYAPSLLFVSEGLIVCPTPGRMWTSFAAQQRLYDGGLTQGGLNRHHHARDGFREKTTGPAFRLNTAVVSPSQPGVLRAARASRLPLGSRERQGHPRNQEQRRQAAQQDRIFGG